MEEFGGSIETQEILTVKEATNYLKVSRRTLYRLLKARKIPALRLGRQWRFRRKDLDGWLENKKVKPRSGRVLVLDDEPQICGFISETLEKVGYNVDSTDNGEEAFQLLQRGDYDLVFVDIELAGISGLQFISKTRRRHSEIKVVAMTDCASLEEAVEAINLAVSGYMIKPLSAQKVIAVVQHVLGENGSGFGGRRYR